MTGDLSGPQDRLRAAIEALDEVVTEARQDLDRFRRDNQPTREELAQLQELARDGELGFDMEELARLVDEDRDTWDAIFSGESPNVDLLQGHLDRMVEENREAVRTALEEDPEFDPFPPDEEL